jgi:formylglycine-generating enzyme required for sulfatase activity
VVNVSKKDAEAYCACLSEVTGKHYRLPTEGEWERAHLAPTPYQSWEMILIPGGAIHRIAEKAAQLRVVVFSGRRQPGGAVDMVEMYIMDQRSASPLSVRRSSRRTIRQKIRNT